jgi:para-nitrobenzyl esterase
MIHLLKNFVLDLALVLALVLALALALLAPAPAFAQTAPTNDPTLVQIDSGLLQGVSTDGVISFKGIPFAQPPIGPLRWRVPRPPKPWEGVREAKTFGPDPLQTIGKTPPIAGLSENCLYLNLWRPDPSAEKNAKPLPVMVWIYGGGLVRGGASIYPGDSLARQGIIVVTFNYRVGRLGFFAHPALAAQSPAEPRGNYGYMDQIAALQWVQRNIAAFGGDPANITIVGESAGGGSVLVLLTSPAARGLFHKAILQSPGIPTARAGATPMRSLAAAESIAVEYARQQAITGQDAAALEKLRALSAQTLLHGTDNYIQAIMGGPGIPGLSHSIIDGQIVVEPPETALRAGRHAKVPIIVGANNADLAASPAHTKDALFAQFGALAPQARALYDPSGNSSLSDLIQAVIADQAMVEPSRHLAQCFTQAGCPAYFYRFSYVLQAHRDKVPGALHAAEIPYAFDAIARLTKGAASKSDLDMADAMSAYWVDFIKTGDPNAPGRPQWKPFDPATSEVLNFTNNGITFGTDPLKERLDLWRSVWEPQPTNTPATQPAPQR